MVPRGEHKRGRREGPQGPMMGPVPNPTGQRPPKRVGRVRARHAALSAPRNSLFSRTATVVFVSLLALGHFCSGQTFLVPNESVSQSSGRFSDGSAESVSPPQAPPGPPRELPSLGSESQKETESAFQGKGPAPAEWERPPESGSAQRPGSESATGWGQTSPGSSTARTSGATRTGDIPLQRRPAPQREDRSLTGSRGGALPWLTMIGALGMVIGVFFLFAWATRRMNAHHNVLLPREVVDVLGQAPLSPRHRLCLIRVGRKVVLVAMTTEGIDTLTEVDDPVEVDRLVGLVASQRSDGSTQMFKNLFAHYLGRDDGHST